MHVFPTVNITVVVHKKAVQEEPLLVNVVVRTIIATVIVGVHQRTTEEPVVRVV